MPHHRMSQMNLLWVTRNVAALPPQFAGFIASAAGMVAGSLLGAKRRV